MKLKTLAAFLLLSATANAYPNAPTECGDMTVWDYATAMCQGKAMPGMPMSMLMIHGNGFVVGDIEEGPRGQNKITVPDMIMGDFGHTFGDNHFVNLDLMLTTERWTFPEGGYPLLLQIGEENANHQPYLDAQHPHSSPIMGLTLSDTYTLNETDYLKISFAPRGSSTDGPTAFMHRQTGLQNPDAPLGHHIGQDVGHITSTVFAAEYRRANANLELSTFFSREPEPSKVDLPMQKPDSWAARFTYQFTKEIHAMASAAYLDAPESHDDDHVWRYSASIYTDAKYASGWQFHDAFVYGLVNFYDHASALNSFLYEVWLNKEANNYWGRIESLERTGAELAIPNAGKNYVSALTVGYSRTLKGWAEGDVRLQVGSSLTKDFLPQDFAPAYGGSGPLTAKVFLQLGGMQMWMND